MNFGWYHPSAHRNIEKSGAYREAKIIEIHAKLIQLVDAVNQVVLMPHHDQSGFRHSARGFERILGGTTPQITEISRNPEPIVRLKSSKSMQN